MGCAASKVDNEDTVRRCKERRRLMKEAVYSRHHLAAAHADYCRSLRLTGSALCAFAAGEPFSVSDQTPTVFLHNTQNPPQLHKPQPPVPQRRVFSTNSVPPSVPSPSPSLHPPPAPPSFSSSPSRTIASSKLPHILSASSISSSVSQRQHRRRKQMPKLPHILSESDPSSSPRNEKSGFSAFFPTAYPNSTYSSTPSQASSVWNWESFCPPSPPPSEFFQSRSRTQVQPKPHRNDGYNDYDDETEQSEYNFFHSKSEGKKDDAHQFQQQKHHHDDTETEREEVQCSDWGDHYSTTSSSDIDEIDGTDADLRSEADTRSNFESTIRTESVAPEPVTPPPPAKYATQMEKFNDAGSSAESFRTGEISDLRMVVRHKDLREIVEALKENFEKAAVEGDSVSKMLEISRAQMDKSFRQLKKTVYHSSSVLSTLSSTWTSKPPLSVKYRLDIGSLDQQGGSKSLCSTLDRLLAWEKKLYEEVKARESVKIEHEKKLSSLQSQEYKGEDEIKLDKTKAAITRLQSLIIVTSQAVNTTSTAIVGLRDSDLIPQLIELCHGFMYMWRKMHQYHDIQNNIVQQVRGLVNQTTHGDSTSDLHRQATRDLESTISAWHSSFCRLIKFQRDFIRSLHGWLKLSFLPVNNDNYTDNKEPSEVFCDQWKLALDRVPDTFASEAINGFAKVVHVISEKQTIEMKIKKRTETASREFEKKSASIMNLERKFYNSYSMVGIGLPDTGPDNGHILDARDPLAEKKVELVACHKRVEEEKINHSKAVEVTRALTLNHLQTGLPGVFQALTNFSALFTEALESVCTHSYSVK
ncbi:hypothetical protein SDJN02_11839 [Cucurbita argyrosperma subsp. argyrosperma]|nr:hypothetical protein SDJN02_11839 [Cucurbita argyrosperma subsp. argyrosperma]